MFTTVRKSLGFIAPVIPNGKHLQQTDPGLLEALLPPQGMPTAGFSRPRTSNRPACPIKYPNNSRTFGTIQDMVVKN
jgi:hypothetical protein